LPGREATEVRQQLGTAAQYAGWKLSCATYPKDGTSIEALLERAYERLTLRRTQQSGTRRRAHSKELLWLSDAMHAVRRELMQLAKSTAPVLIHGERGTGRELIARQLHADSDRNAAPFRAVNCADLPETLLECTLFGHEQGAFSGANQLAIGAFEQANGGTVFLDEIESLTPNTQAALLRVLQSGYVRRIGASQDTPVNVRLVTATRGDLLETVQRGRFRPDLLQRINAKTLTIPPLRERREEIKPLAQTFLLEAESKWRLQQHRISEASFACLEAYDWPGNVGELRHVIQRAGALCNGSQIEPEHLPEALSQRKPETDLPPTPGASAPEGFGDLSTALKAQERQFVQRALARSAGNHQTAADLLGISLESLQQRMQRLGMS
jgi:DNA-binding NtrC family response regulator